MSTEIIMMKFFNNICHCLLSLKASVVLVLIDSAHTADYNRISASSLRYVLKLKGVCFTSVHQLSSAGLSLRRGKSESFCMVIAPGM